MGLFARRNERDEERYRTKVKKEHDATVKRVEDEKRARHVRQDRKAAARARVNARLAAKKAARRRRGR